jgi:hypothetical protein
VEAFDGAYRHAIREAAEMAIVSDDVSHISRNSNSETNTPANRTNRLGLCRCLILFQRSPECKLCVEPRKCRPIDLQLPLARARERFYPFALRNPSACGQKVAARRNREDLHQRIDASRHHEIRLVQPTRRARTLRSATMSQLQALAISTRLSD